MTNTLTPNQITEYLQDINTLVDDLSTLSYEDLVALETEFMDSVSNIQAQISMANQGLYKPQDQTVEAWLPSANGALRVNFKGLYLVQNKLSQNKGESSAALKVKQLNIQINGLQQEVARLSRENLALSPTRTHEIEQIAILTEKVHKKDSALNSKNSQIKKLNSELTAVRRLSDRSHQGTSSEHLYARVFQHVASKVLQYDHYILLCEASRSVFDAMVCMFEKTEDLEVFSDQKTLDTLKSLGLGSG